MSCQVISGIFHADFFARFFAEGMSEIPNETPRAGALKDLPQL